MPSPFPGIDPYLEQATFWSSFHSRLIVALADALAPQQRPRYCVEVETCTYTDRPDGGETRSQAEFYTVTVREALSCFPLPLQTVDSPILVDLS
ncbi:hypothetical protein C8255_23845 [filamentous cyanobacterium CCP3]|nr:hypothetical protein C8255_23845 [filamentous cyanobacterium CCP3]